MQRDIIWITGPSGGGKTEVINRLSGLLDIDTIYTDAYEMLHLNRIDTDHRYHIHPFSDEQFLLTTSHHFDQAIMNLVDKVRSTSRDTPKLIELARGVGNNKEINASYERLSELLPISIQERSILVHINTPYESRVSFNNPRRIKDFKTDLPHSSFKVPNLAMESFYISDDLKEARQLFRCPVVVVENSGGHSSLLHAVDELSINLKSILRTNE